MTNQYRGPEWVEPIESDLHEFIKEGRRLQADAMHSSLTRWFAALKRALVTFRHVAELNSDGPGRRQTLVHPTLN